MSNYTRSHYYKQGYDHSTIDLFLDNRQLDSGMNKEAESFYILPSM